ncbi:MAG: helix-turn-helix domain-containing protein [Oscillospiraceae bacterium]
MEQVISSGRMPGLEVEEVVRDSEYILAVEHFHQYHEIYYLLSGQRTFFIQDNVYNVAAGDLVVINAGQIHKIGPNEHSAHGRILLRIEPVLLEEIAVFLHEEALPGFFARHGGVMRLNRRQQQELESILGPLQAALGKKKDGQPVARIHLAAFFAFLLREEPEGEVAPSLEFTPPKLQKVQEVARYIAANYQEPLSLEGLEKRFYISRYHLCRIFKEITGFTVNDYLHTNRIVNAQRLLRRTAHTITQVAQEVGYSSVTQFDKKFRAVSGLSPSAYRKS